MAQYIYGEALLADVAAMITSRARVHNPIDI